MRISVEPSAAASDGFTARAATAAPAVIAPFSTNGWDTVFVITLPDVNNAIAAQGSSPSTWSGMIPGGLFNPEINATGSFGTWSLTTGGSGAIIRMHIPFTANVVSGGNQINVQGGTAYIEVKLAYLPQPSSGPTTPNNLMVRTDDGTVDDPTVTVSAVTYTTPSIPNPSLDNVLQQLLQTWFNNNLATFAHVFATVDVGLDEGAGDFAWLCPTTTSYAYLDNADITQAVLGVLCMTENRSSQGATQEISPGAIPAGARSSFNISLERVLTKMVMPGLPLEFGNAPVGTFVLGSDGTQIRASQDFNLDSVEVAASSYTPTVTHFSITFENGQLVTDISVHTPISPGIDAYFTGTYYNTISLATKTDGTQSLTWSQTQDPVTNSWSTVADWVQVTEIIASVITAVVGAAVGILESTIERVVVKVLVALLVGGVVGAIVQTLEMIPEWMANTVPGPAPSVSALVDGATKPLRWADSKDFQITTAALNGGLQLGGNPFTS